MQELLLTFACFTNAGCNESAIAYKHYNNDTVKYYENHAERILAHTPILVKNYLAPILTINYGGSGVFTLNEHLTLKLSKSSSSLTYSINID